MHCDRCGIDLFPEEEEQGVCSYCLREEREPSYDDEDYDDRDRDESEDFDGTYEDTEDDE